MRRPFWSHFSDGLAGRASRNLARLALSWKVGTVVKNLVIPAFGTAKRIGWANWWKGLARLAAGKVSYKEFREADFIQRRVDAGFSPEVRAALTRLRSEKPTRLAKGRSERHCPRRP